MFVLSYKVTAFFKVVVAGSVIAASVAEFFLVHMFTCIVLMSVNWYFLSVVLSVWRYSWGVLFLLCMQILCVFCMVFSFMVTVNGVVFVQLTVGVSFFVLTVSRVNTVSSMGRIVSKSILITSWFDYCYGLV